jgi:hypothetical protein
VNLACALKVKTLVRASAADISNAEGNQGIGADPTESWCGGHDVRVVTTHHDPSRCFDETKPDGETNYFDTYHIRLHHDDYCMLRNLLGVLGKDIVVYGSWLPRHLYRGRYLTAFFASIRMVFAAMRVVLGHVLSEADRVDVVLIDGVSTPIPLFQVMSF